MRTSLSLATVVALVVSVGPALACERFHVFSQLPMEQQAALTPLPNAQLAGIEGGDVTLWGLVTNWQRVMNMQELMETVRLDVLSLGETVRLDAPGLVKMPVMPPFTF